MKCRLALAALAALALISSGAGEARARTAQVVSFDGTEIKASFFPTDAVAGGGRAPTVLVGPGWGLPGSTDPAGATEPSFGSIGLGPLRAAGFNVLTWDPRGFHGSSGTVQVDSPQYEGRDVQALIDFVAQQPEAMLDRVCKRAGGSAGKKSGKRKRCRPNTRDPRIGMAGPSYGGGIQLAVAGMDRRIDAIVPDIAWHSLATGIYQDAIFKAGWGSILFGLASLAGDLPPELGTAFANGLTTGRISAEDERWFVERSYSHLVKRIRVPTFLVHGTVDTLFPLDEAIANYRILRRSGVPLKMLWFCGGHGACFTHPGDTGRVEQQMLRWLRRWLTRDRSVSTGPGFEWVNQDGVRLTAREYPPPHGAIQAIDRGGPLAIQQAGGSGPSAPGLGLVGAVAAATNGTRAANAVELRVPGRRSKRQLVGAPTLTLRYSGAASPSDVRVFAQLVDDDTGLVLGNQVTPIPLELDGRSRRVKRPLEVIAHTLRRRSSVTLQITASATNYGPQRATGTVDFQSVNLVIPVRSAAKKRRQTDG